MQERLQKLIAQAGITSRRDAENLIAKGRVMVNGLTAHLGDKADPAVDDVRVDGEKLNIDTKRIYLMINKPMGIVTATRAQSQEVRRTVRDLVPIEGHLYPVGRLDADSEGLVVLTDDGELAQKLTHPRYQHPKVYEVTLRGLVPEDVLSIWRRGVVLDDGLTKPVDIQVLSRDKDLSQIRITMREGRKRQIRRIAKLLGYPVKRLVRTELDTLLLGDLAVGTWRYLTEGEIRELQQSAASTKHRLKVDPRYNPVFDPRSRKKPAQPREQEQPDEYRPRPASRSAAPRAAASRGSAARGPASRSTRRSASTGTRRPRPSSTGERRETSPESRDSAKTGDSTDSSPSDERRQRPPSRSGTRSASRPGTRSSGARRPGGSAGRAGSRASGKPGGRTGGRPNSKSNNKPGSRSSGKPHSKPANRSAGKPRSKPGGKPRSKPRDGR